MYLTIAQRKRLASPEVLMKVGARLRNNPVLWTGAAFAVRILTQPRRGKQIQSYLDRHQVRKLRLGSGRHVDPGWLSADLVPLARQIVFMDARKPLPLPDASFDFILCEHILEHLELPQARALLGECRRVLRDGGVLRLATPNLGRLLQFAQNPGEEDAAFYVAHQNRDREGVSQAEVGNPVYMLNRVMHDWGHEFLFDQPTLEGLLRETGFQSIERCEPGISRHGDLRHVDRHAEEVGSRVNEIESLIVEASA